MTAAMPGPIAEPEAQELTVHEWLEFVRAETESDQSGPMNSMVATICAAAVDSLEIAANLEASGISRQVVTDQYDQPDVFALADELWTKVAFRPVPIPDQPIWRKGSPQDLGRGALYAAPALMLLALTRALGVHFAWWALPLAITWGWALGQVTAYAGYSLRTRQKPVGEKVAVGWLMVSAIVTTAGLGFVATALLGGELASVLCATGVTTYMVSSAILLLNEQEALAAKLLVPGGIVTIAILALGIDSFSAAFAWINIGGSALATLAAAGRYMRLTPLKSVTFVRGDFRTSMHHMAHGLMCGIALTMVAILGSSVFVGAGNAALLTLPLLLTLGIMEWQLRSFRAGVERLASTVLSLDDFAPRSWALFRRALLWYLFATGVMSVVVAIVIQLDHVSSPYLLLVAQVALGAAFYVDLTLVSLDRLDLVIRCWMIGFAAGAVWWAAAHPFAQSADSNTALWSAAVVATTATLASLIVVSPSVVSASMSH
jgi:hypothetical protein